MGKKLDKKRICLRCEIEFWSGGSCNRHCEICLQYVNRRDAQFPVGYVKNEESEQKVFDNLLDAWGNI